MAKKYRTAMEAAMAFALCCIRFAGIKEGGKEHKELIRVYNTISPLPYGYTMTTKDAWCAAFLSAIAKLLGYTKFPFECSCSRMLKKAQDMGLPTWGRGYEPKIGDGLIYDLDKNKAVDHVGVVVWVQDGKCWVVEGNYSNAVKVRCIAIDDPIVYAWICFDWMEQVDNSNFVDGDRPNIPIEIPAFKEDEDMPSNEKIYNQVSEMAYTGGNPWHIGEELGPERYRDAVAGSDGVRYYVSMVREDGESEILCYDTRHRVWHREDGMKLVGLGWHADLYALEERGELWVLGDRRDTGNGEEGVASWVETADYYDGTTRKKTPGRLVLRLEIDDGVDLDIKIRYDSRGDWELLRRLTGEMVKGQEEIVVALRRCDHYRIRLEGLGLGGRRWTLHALTRERAVGSNRK